MKTKSSPISALSLNFLAVTALLVFFAASCTKSDNNTNFPGTYYGHFTMGSYDEADTITVTSGSSSSIAMLCSLSTGSTYTINGTTNGSAVNVPAQSVFVSHYDTTYTVSGSGTLSGNSQTLQLSLSYVSPSHSTYNWTYNGTK